jgi:arylsulfatase
MTPFRSETNTNWGGAFGVPELIRWPAKIAAGTVSNEIVQHHDWLPTFLAASGEPDIVEQLKAGHTISDKSFKVHIDGYNLLHYLTGETDKSPRQGSRLLLRRRRRAGTSLRQLEGRVHGAARAGDAADMGRAIRGATCPQALNLRTDPFERADGTSNTYYDWFVNNDYIALAATAVVTQFLETFKDFPPRQKAASFTIDQVVEKLETALTSGP